MCFANCFLFTERHREKSIHTSSSKLYAAYETKENLLVFSFEKKFFLFF